MIGVIVAYDLNKAIGKAGKIPWKIPGEQKQFKELTTGNIIVMGRKTYEEIGHPLPDRINVLISSTYVSDTERHYDENSGLYIYHSLDKFIEDYKIANSILRFTYKNYIKDFKGKDLYGTGGRRIFENFLKIADVLYTTEIDHNYGGDTFFPYFENQFVDSGERFEVVEVKDSNGIKITYTRKKYIKK